MSLLFEPENLLPKDGIAIYHGVVFNEKEATQICKDLFETIPWKQDEVLMFGKKIMTKRKVAWYADAGITYTYAGVKKSGLQWTEALLGIKQKVEAITGARYNACLLNLYHEGEEGVGILLLASSKFSCANCELYLAEYYRQQNYKTLLLDSQ